MTMKEISGNLFHSKADVLCHQVNTYGVMGAGIALEVRKRFPEVFRQYSELCQSVPGDEVLLGYALILPSDQNGSQYIANLFGQTGWGTDYKHLESSLQKALDWMERNGKQTIAFPYKMSCGLAGGNWNIVKGIIRKTFEGENVDVEIWKLEVSDNA